MKAEIDENGTLTVKPEKPLEVYALKQWAKENLTTVEGATHMTTKAGSFLIQLNIEGR